ncbi:MAG: hypothetical protein KDB01_08060, partial [Planctomycetaceae bacterium]|nr:hypothetical protein [Planctomycetaceae bacterium]
MVMHRNSFFAVVLVLANCQCLYGQSEQSQDAANTDAASQTQIALRVRFFELNGNRATRSAFAELYGKQTGTDSAEPAVSSPNENEIVQSTEEITRFLDDLGKVSKSKVLSETQLLLSPGVQIRYQHGEEMDFTKSPPTLVNPIELIESVDSDRTSVDAAGNRSNRFVGATILATGTIEQNQSVKLAVNAEYAEIDNSRKTNKLSGRKVHSAGVNVVLGKDQSLILGPWESSRELVTTQKIPVPGSL